MHSSDNVSTWLALLARAADTCLKPWLHAVVLADKMDIGNSEVDLEKALLNNHPIDLIVRIECRTREGDRQPDRDIELEIYRSGEELNLMLSWLNQPDRPILWQGQHHVWMDGNTGVRCSPPTDGPSLEALGRRLRALFVIPEKN